MFSFKKSKLKTKEAETENKSGFLGRLRQGLSRTRTSLTGNLSSVFSGKAIDAGLLEEIEDTLIMADIGVRATRQIIDDLEQRLSRKELKDATALTAALRENMAAILQPCDNALIIPDKPHPFVILVAGVNGVGKTTTIGKLAKRLQQGGKSVMLAAGDTFRAAAVEQLQTWGERNDIPVIAQAQGADSASVIFDAFESAKARNIDVLIADTAGRLHTQSHLMDELKKVIRVLKKIDPDAPHETLLVLDAGTGQNALNQAEQFNAAVNLSGICLTKLDGTAKGGVIFSIAQKLKLPIRFIGVGEGIDDLRVFEADEFIDALFSEEQPSEE
ncbi:Signal recognition particle receptor FtsY [hydrothermal vent metagenome]|uniref:Signal recognition particle receptor FtsY n=1 Tax=hydrothermal vent metagenome TaxID=652676 RepID=A0A3B0ZRX8_9ZZZZ